MSQGERIKCFEAETASMLEADVNQWLIDDPTRDIIDMKLQTVSLESEGPEERSRLVLLVRYKAALLPEAVQPVSVSIEEITPVASNGESAASRAAGELP